jgi:putative ATP-binding cassette transporter
VVERLTTFERAIAEIERATLAGDGFKLDTHADSDLELAGVSLNLPDGRALVDHADLSFASGERVLVTGASGSGKSTLFRTLAGIWPFGRGRITKPESARMLFLPQRTYLPIGTLADVLRYPERSLEVSEQRLTEILQAVGLPHLIPALHEHAHWAQRLSGGEQQRIAIARALVIQPDWLFLDEATSAVDEDAESELYRLLEQHLPQASIISIGHRASLRAYHGRELRLARDPASGQPGHFVDQAIPAGATA